MKKLIFTLLVFAIAQSVYSQTRIGLIVAPQISSNRVDFTDSNDLLSIDNDGSALRFKFGLEFDFMWTDNYGFSTGLIYSPKRVGLSVSDGTDSFQEEYKVQYLQLPATLKLFTSEIAPDLKAYFQLGFMGEIKLYDEPFNDDYFLVDEFSFFDVSFVGGAGVEYGPGVNTILYGGLFYDRGLTNILADQDNSIEDEITIRTSALYLKLGLKF